MGNFKARANCGSNPITKNGNDYVCNYCRAIQVVAQSRNESKSKGVIPQTKYGKINSKVDNAKSIGKFTLEPKSIVLTYAAASLQLSCLQKNLITFARSYTYIRT